MRTATRQVVRTGLARTSSALAASHNIILVDGPEAGIGDQAADGAVW